MSVLCFYMAIAEPTYQSDPFFDDRSKHWACFLTAILVAIVMTIEDAMHDDSSVLEITLEFVVFAPALTLLLIGFGRLAKLSLEWWRQNKWFKKGKISELIFGTTWVTVTSLILALIAILIEENLGLDDDGPSFFDFYWMVWVGALITVTIAFVIEIFWEMMTKRQALEVMNERLLRNQEMAKYQALMNQVNPHFLFNSLNVLSYLVYQSPKDADRFIEELSKMYRYILQLNEAYVVPLKKELEFIDSYIFLQKIRYQGNLNFESKVGAKALNQLIPPLTLEVLVENAIKHNIIANKQPLNIELTTQNGHLIVRNQYQPRMENEVTSTKVGLKNLTEKFAILETEAPEFFTENGHFVAKVPLLKPEI